MPVDRLKTSSLRRAPTDALREGYILENSHLERLLFDRHLMGPAFRRECEAASRSYLEHFKPDVAKAGDDIAEMLLLSKGLCYGLGRAYEDVFGRGLDLNMAGTNRVAVNGEDASVRVAYTNFDAPASTLIIGDTVATGRSIMAVLDLYKQRYELKHVFVFSIAGSRVGGRAIDQYCIDAGIRLTLVYGLAMFGLSTNGFDLSFLHPDTVTSSAYRTRARAVYGDGLVSVAGWDFGSQAQARRKYRMLCALEREYHGLDGAALPIADEIDPILVEKEAVAGLNRDADVSVRSIGKITPLREVELERAPYRDRGLTRRASR